ncbi:MAG TPA: hypothetical protein VNJ04_04035 [Gemmatimonadaceae bacterium]|nr:hypothetical protein [Gemmatimonadaceae bacterium]
MILAEPALDALLRALKTAPPCDVCGRSEADRDPVVIRAAQIVLDRAGFHPTLAVVQQTPANKFANCSEDELIDTLHKMLADACARRDQQRQWLIDVGSSIEDGCVIPGERETLDATDLQQDEHNPTGICTSTDWTNEGSVDK